MTTLADAAAFVPPKESEPEDNLLSQGVNLARMGLHELLEIMVVPSAEDQQTLEFTFEGIGEYFGKRKEDKAFLEVVGEVTKEEDEEQDEELEEAEHQKKKGASVMGRIAKWLFQKVIKWGFKQVIKLALRAVRWIIKEVVVRAVEMVIDFLVRPVLTGVLEFIGVNPELWPFVAIFGGVAALAYLAWDKLFKGSAQVPEAVATPTSHAASAAVASSTAAPVPAGTVVAQASRAIAAPAIAAGAVAAAGAPSSLEALISRGEGNYNSVNLGAAHGYKATTMNLEGMSVADIQRGQKNHDFNAVGRYQIIGSTLDAAVKALKLTGFEKFDRTLQDRIFNEYLIGQKRHAIADYISGKSNDINAAILAASQEWASVAAPAGAKLQNGSIGDGLVSYYAGVANNKASISAAEMAKTLNEERAGQASTTQLSNTPAQMRPGVATSATSATGSQLGQPVQQASTMTQPTPQKTVIKDKNGNLIAVNA